MNTEAIVDWYRRARKSNISPGQAQELYFQFHPRTAFLKMLPADAKVADIGAGDGSLSVFRKWPSPSREDLRLYAYSIEKGERFDQFEAYEISDWNQAPPEFGGVEFDAVVSAHFIEHIDEPASFAAWLARKLKPGGRAYVEWPSDASLSLPSKHDLAHAGVDLVISRFDDDGTHQILPRREDVERFVREAGLAISAAGVVRLPWLEEELMAHFRDAGDRFPSQAAFWSWSGWCQYLIIEKLAP